MDLKELLNKLNLYETLGYFLVGILTITLLYLNNIILKTTQINIHDFKNELILPFLLLSYFLGHLVQAISNIVYGILGNKIIFFKETNEFTESDKVILNEAKNHFQLPASSNERTVWGSLITYNKKNDYIGEVNRFNSYYSLYRGWALVFLLNIVIFSVEFIYLRSNWYIHKQFWFFNALFLIVGIVFLIRSKRFWNYTKYKTFQSYKLNKIQ